MNKCLICFESVEETINNFKVCKRCKDKLRVIEKIIYVDNVEVLILYLYEDFFKQILYRYKGCYDIALRGVFLNGYLVKLKRKYKNRKIVCAPSFSKDDENRGFNHVEEIAKLLDLDIIRCLKKNKNYKQSDQKMIDRGHIQNIIEIDKSKINDKDRLLIIDDVTTSLSTLKTIIGLLSTNVDKKALIIASSCRFMENENI